MCPFWDSKDKGWKGLVKGEMGCTAEGLNDLLIKPGTQGNSLRAFGFVVDSIGSKNSGLNSGTAEGLNDLLIKPRTQGNSLRIDVMFVDITGSDNPGLNSPAAKDGLTVNHLNLPFQL